MLEIRNVTKSYDEKAVLSSVCFTLLDGESLLLAGETGGGKTTLARIICGSQCPDSGEVLLDGRRLLGTYRKRSPGELADIQYIFQDPYSAVELTSTPDSGRNGAGHEAAWARLSSYGGGAYPDGAGASGRYG